MSQGLGATLADIAHEIPALALGDAVNLISRARRVSIFALDPLAQCVALDAHARFLRLGVDSSVHFSADEQRLVAANGGEGAAYLLFGTEPSTGEVAEFSEIFELQRKPSALIAPNSTPMIRFTGIHVSVRTLRASDMFASSALRYRLLLIVDLLCTALALNLAGSLQQDSADSSSQTPPPIKR
jgi:DNA-binding MurR/RpiR family transcriptional regulator